MTRIAIDWDADGAYALITRPGAAAEHIPLSHRDAVRLMSEAAQAVLLQDRLFASRNMTPSAASCEGDYLAPPHFIGALGE